MYFSPQILQAVHTVRVLLFHIDGVLRVASRSAAHRSQTADHQLHVHIDHGGHHADGLRRQRVHVARQRLVRRDDDDDDRVALSTAGAGHRRNGAGHRRVVGRQRHRSCQRYRRRYGELARQEFGQGPAQEHVEPAQPDGQDQLHVQIQQGMLPLPNEQETPKCPFNPRHSHFHIFAFPCPPSPFPQEKTTSNQYRPIGIHRVSTNLIVDYILTVSRLYPDNSSR